MKGLLAIAMTPAGSVNDELCAKAGIDKIRTG
jgi:hypothetical protein